MQSDRARSAERVRRIHVIDTCQALDLPVACEYQRNFGSSHDVRYIRDGVSFHSLLFAWADFANRTGLQRAHLAREMKRMADAARAAASAHAEMPEYQGAERDFAKRIGAFVQAQAGKLLETRDDDQALTG